MGRSRRPRDAVVRAPDQALMQQPPQQHVFDVAPRVDGRKHEDLVALDSIDHPPGSPRLPATALASLENTSSPVRLLPLRMSSSPCEISFSSPRA